MEYLDGTNLEEIIKKSSKIDFMKSYDQIANMYAFFSMQNLIELKEANIIANDIKPENT